MTFLEAREEVKVHALDWAMLCPHQERLLFDVFFVLDDVSVERAIAALRALVHSALDHDHC